MAVHEYAFQLRGIMGGERMYYTYEKLDENYNLKTVSEFTNDTDGSITGHIVMGVKQWFDENPEERKRLGWIKHIHPDENEIEYNRQSQYVIISEREIDPYTVEDVYHVVDKSEEQMLLEEMLECAMWNGRGRMAFTTRNLGGLVI